MQYLIDTENVGGGWIRMLDNLPADVGGNVLAIYTDKTARICCGDVARLMSYKGPLSVSFQKCTNGKENALDFFLLATLAVMAHQNMGEEYVIVSNDTGYDEALRVLTAGGVKARRIPCSNRPQNITDLLELGGVSENAEHSSEIAAAQAPNKAAEAQKSPSQPALTTAQKKALGVKQRAFLISKCAVPKAVADPIRNAMNVSLKATEALIMRSKAKSFKTPPKIKEKIMDNLRKHWEEYNQITL